MRQVRSPDGFQRGVFPAWTGRRARNAFLELSLVTPTLCQVHINTIGAVSLGAKTLHLPKIAISMTVSNGNDNGHAKPLRFLIWGQEGWIAGKLKALLQDQGRDVHVTAVRMENREAVVRELARVEPTHVLNAAGCTGRPNVDWCEDNKEETIRSNVIGTLNLTDCCFQAGVHCTVFATGCIYHYDDAHPVGGPGFTEEDEPNFQGSFYSLTKGCLETVSRCRTASTLVSVS